MGSVNPEVLGINYVEKTYEDLMTEYLETALAMDLLTASQKDEYLEAINKGEKIENTLVMEFSNHALVLADKYKNTLTPMHNALDMSKAIGEDLEAIGIPLIGPKRPAQYSVTDVYIKCDEAMEQDIIYPAGTIFTTDDNDPVAFESIAECTLLKGTTEVMVYAQCTVPGTIGNVFPHEIVKVLDSDSGIYCDNPVEASGGKPMETDMEYLQRLMIWRFSQKTGNLDAIEEAIGSVSACNGYYIHRYWNGRGTVKIIVDPPTQIVLELVTGAVDRKQALDDDFTIVPVEDVLINLALVVNVSLDLTIPLSEVEKQAILVKVQNYIKVYIEGGMNADGSTQKPLSIGKDFIPFKCAKYLSDQIPEIQSLQFTYPMEPISIQSHERARCGTVTASVV